MAKLENKNHEEFCHEYLAHEKRAGEAYRKVYGDKTGANASASRLLKTPGVQERIWELQDKISKRIDITVENVLEFADRIRHECLGCPVVLCEETGDVLKKEKKPDYTNALKANEQIARIIGAFNDKLELSGKEKTIEQIITEAKEKK